LISGIAGIMLITVFLWQPWNSQENDNTSTGQVADNTETAENIASDTILHDDSLISENITPDTDEEIEEEPEVKLPSLSTGTPTDISKTSAILSGKISDAGNGTISERGIVYSSSRNPTTSNSKVRSGSGTGSFTANITGLEDNTTYYVRAYAINEAGTAYGDEQSFKTEIKKVSFTETTAGLNLEMVFVKGGTFEMGCTSEQSDCDDDEKPVHSVTVDDFYIGKYEVTQAQWKAIMGSNPSHFDDCGSNCPVENVSWNDVQEFIEKLNQKTGKNYRLPTEAEWEYAARGGGKSKGYKYAGSNSIGTVAWYDDNSGSETHPVGQKQANELGIYDMSGNVWEWCSDWYDSDYYSSSPRNNPAGPSSGSRRVLRGGSWGSRGRICRVANRNNLSPGSSYSNSGFRLVLPR
jgi:formylglycine-generating enzyme required for sulfatase activity